MLRLTAVSLAFLVIPLGLDLYLPVPVETPMTRSGVAQGRALFFDRRLSRNGTVSCASCHRPELGFADAHRVAVGIDARMGRRHVPTLINRGYGRAFGWAGRQLSLEDQVAAAIADPNEMDSSASASAIRVGVTREAMTRALASYVRSILSGDSAYDRYAAGLPHRFSPQAAAGLALFRGRANCTACHSGPNFTDERIHNTGVAWRDGVLRDAGGGAGAFKTPTLREIARTPPYMHDGSLTSLDDVIDFYDRGGIANPALDAEVRRLALTSEERRALVAFLKSLSGQVLEGASSSGRSPP